MPASFVKGKEGEPMWKRAKEIIKKEYGDIEKSDPEKFYSLVTTVYKSVCTKHQCGPKKKMSEMMEVFGNIGEAVSIFGAESAIEKGLDRARAMVEIFRKEPYLKREKADMKKRFDKLYQDMGDIVKELE